MHPISLQNQHQLAQYLAEKLIWSLYTISTVWSKCWKHNLSDQMTRHQSSMIQCQCSVDPVSYINCYIVVSIMLPLLANNYEIKFPLDSVLTCRFSSTRWCDLRSVTWCNVYLYMWLLFLSVAGSLVLPLSMTAHSYYVPLLSVQK